MQGYGVCHDLTYHSGICLEGLRKTTKTSVRTVDVPTEIRSMHFSNIIQKPNYLEYLCQSFIEMCKLTTKFGPCA
jgi:hypothetical protein